ncbi:sigma-70 family RNA polymerase sigma factor [Agrobacterium rubi]|uniref:RNA polymerase sigma factor n=2 Tax=Agrobacterium rubi TaxID=28099 RepID=A0AAE7R8U2_9HYPH|nr:sigma-70 family RNA polymerase sigma factor [Agrobacterium rubi]MBP1878964.1 RNA polymerase sigma-70 factor (ECF subfamily) [Agrobacterium rubi]MCL6652683.1 RNA polymerase subunit sigma [Agrobacterium rubi]NTE87447.1 sigma-70 family RNA polymerase sigma factor [Agrobacterium rubi]NTF03301.1 sigma-70 family RNA polymerase sigma factor [Agrobacterium rubi]NTF09782.1 sigma-70 family RNA polymerase sigma factor [Agrobacterium rubi]
MSSLSPTGFSHLELTNCVPALRNFATRFYKTSNDVDDLVQETLMRALANSEKFQRGTRLKSWLFTIMRNLFCSKFVVARREQVGLTDNALAAPKIQPVQEWAVRGNELVSAISDLPDNYRDALWMVFVEGISYDEASSRCACPVGTIKSRVNRARASLMRTLGEASFT